MNKFKYHGTCHEMETLELHYVIFFLKKKYAENYHKHIIDAQLIGWLNLNRPSVAVVVLQTVSVLIPQTTNKSRVNLFNWSGGSSIKKRQLYFGILPKPV